MPPGARHIRPAFYCASWQYPPTLCRSRTADNRIDNERQLRSRACLQNGITPTIVTLFLYFSLILRFFSRYSFLEYTMLPRFSFPRSKNSTKKITQWSPVASHDGSMDPQSLSFSHKAAGSLPRWKWLRRTRHRDINHTPYYRATRSRRVDSQPSFPLRCFYLPLAFLFPFLHARVFVPRCRFYLFLLVSSRPTPILRPPYRCHSAYNGTRTRTAKFLRALFLRRRNERSRSHEISRSDRIIATVWISWITIGKDVQCLDYEDGKINDSDI